MNRKIDQQSVSKAYFEEFQCQPTLLEKGWGVKCVHLKVIVSNGQTAMMTNNKKMKKMILDSLSGNL